MERAAWLAERPASSILNRLLAETGGGPGGSLQPSPAPSKTPDCRPAPWWRRLQKSAPATPSAASQRSVAQTLGAPGGQELFFPGPFFARATGKVARNRRLEIPALQKEPLPGRFSIAAWFSRRARGPFERRAPRTV